MSVVEPLLREQELRVRLVAGDRKKIAQQMHEKGFSQRQIAAFTGSSQMQISRDLAETNGSKSETNVSPAIEITAKTGSPETVARRAAVAARASAQGVTPAPTGKYRIIYADPQRAAPSKAFRG